MGSCRSPQKVTTQPLPLDDSPKDLSGLFQAIKLGIFTPALRAAQVSLASSGLSSNLRKRKKDLNADG
jgi:hypothetical protein